MILLYIFSGNAVFVINNILRCSDSNNLSSGFTAAREKQARGDEAYGGRIARSVAKMEHDEQTGMDPAKAGAYIASLALRRSVKPLYAIRADYKFFVMLSRLLPVRTLSWLVYQLYAK